MPVRTRATPSGEVPSDVFGIIEDLGGKTPIGVFRTFGGDNGPRSFTENFGWDTGQESFPASGFRIRAVSTPTSSSMWQSIPNGYFDTSHTEQPPPIGAGDRPFRVVFDHTKPPVAFFLVQAGPSLSWYGNPSSTQINASGLIPFGATGDVLAFHPIGSEDWPSAVYPVVADCA
jgi:hypothetical protein